MNRQQNEKRDETQKARKLIDKDMSDADTSSGHKGSLDQKPQPFRPDENVDNQKAENNPSSPAHNTSMKETPIPGAQLAKEKKAHKDNIDRKTDEVDPQGSE